LAKLLAEERFIVAVIKKHFFNMVAPRLAAIGALHVKKLLRNPIDTVIRATLNINMER